MFLIKKKLTYVLVASVLLNVILGYGMFSQWRSRTVQFMDNYQRLHGDVMLTVAHLDRYLDNGSTEDLEQARIHQRKAFERHSIFSTYYYYSHPGTTLTGYIFDAFDPMNLADENAPYSQYHADLEAILEALTVDDEDCLWETRSIPRHSINRSFIRDLLDQFEEILGVLES